MFTLLSVASILGTYFLSPGSSTISLMKPFFGIWKKISTAQLVCPLDTHVHRVATGLGLIKRRSADWQAAIELTEQLKRLDPTDPVKYDYALFGLGVEEKF